MKLVLVVLVIVILLVLMFVDWRQNMGTLGEPSLPAKEPLARGFKSCAEWPPGTCDGLGNYTDDTHDSREAAEAVCQLLEMRGFGGDGMVFPLRTYVEEIY